METLDIETKIKSIVNKISGQNIDSINRNGNIKNELSLDSVQLVELFANLEQEFNTELPLKLMTVRTCNEFLQILQESIHKTSIEAV